MSRHSTHKASIAPPFGTPVSYRPVIRASDLARARRMIFDRGRAAVLAALCYQGFVLAMNGVSAPWMMRSFGLDQASIARAFAWISVSSIGAFALARAADKVGRRRILMWSLSSGSVASAIA